MHCDLLGTRCKKLLTLRMYWGFSFVQPAFIIEPILFTPVIAIFLLPSVWVLHNWLRAMQAFYFLFHTTLFYLLLNRRGYSLFVAKYCCSEAGSMVLILTGWLYFKMYSTLFLSITLHFVTGTISPTIQ